MPALAGRSVVWRENFSTRLPEGGRQCPEVAQVEIMREPRGRR